jgi:O-antigen ligase
MQSVSTTYNYYEPEELPYAQDNIRPYSRLAEWFVLIVWTLLCWEGVFGQYFRDALPKQEAWWMRLTPWSLYPSELGFYNPFFLLIVVFITMRGRTVGYKTVRGIGPLLILIAMGMWGAFHGFVAGAPGNYWLADFRQSFLMAIFVPFFAVIAPRIRVDKLMERFYKIGIVATVYCGIAGMLVFAGIWNEFDRQVPYWHGSFVLILMYILALTRIIVTGKNTFSSMLLVLALAFGILAPLHKPATVGFVIANMMILVIVFLKRKTLGTGAMGRSFIVFVIMCIFAVGLLSYVFTIGGGTAVEWVQRKFFKMHVAGGGDITGGRLEFWGWGLAQWKMHPFFGTGYGFWVITSTGEGITRYLPIHNTIIETLYQMGLIGFIVIGWTVLFCVVRMFRFIKTCKDPDDWPLIGMFIWVVTMLVASCYGKNLGLTSVGFVFWICVAFLSNAEAQHFMAINYENTDAQYQR